MSIRRRRPQLLLLEVLLGGLLAAGAIGVLSGALRNSRDEHRAHQRERLSHQLLKTEELRFLALSREAREKLPATRVVGNLVVTRLVLGAGERLGCERMRIQIHFLQGPMVLVQDLERCP